MRGQEPAQELDGSLRLLLLHECEHGVEDDDRDDRSRDDHRSGDRRQACRQPQQQGQRVRELSEEITWP
jgi:hypothetical protein